MVVVITVKALNADEFFLKVIVHHAISLQRSLIRIQQSRVIIFLLSIPIIPKHGVTKHVRTPYIQTLFSRSASQILHQ